MKRRAQMEKKSINRSIAGFSHDMSYEKVPDSVIHRAKLVLLDILGAIIHERDMECPRLALLCWNQNPYKGQ
jgi:2-methylcitrate dehydratase PrpD